MKGRPFGPGHRGNTNGRPPGIKNWWTAARDQLRQALPEAIEHVKAGAAAGDPDMIKLLFSVVFPRTKATFPPLALDLTHQFPRDVLDGAKRLLADGAITIDHYTAILDGLAKTSQIETAIAMAAREVHDAEPLDMAKALTVTAAQCGDLSTTQDSLAKVLQYSVPRPEPLPPEPIGIVSSEPVGLDGEDWEQAYGSPDGGQHD